MKEDIRITAERCAELYMQYSEKRKQVLYIIMCHVRKFIKECLKALGPRYCCSCIFLVTLFELGVLFVIPVHHATRSIYNCVLAH